MDYVQLANADMSISRFSLGTWAFSGAKVWGQNDEAESIRVIDMAIAAGVNVFDTAAKYGDGRAEQVLGRAIQKRRAKVIVATKVPADCMRRDQVIAACETSLTHLGTDYIDLYQVHWPSRTVPIDETMDALDCLRRQGKIRAIGVCNHGPQCIDAVKKYAVATNQMPYSLIWRQIEDEIVPASVESGMAVWAYCPLAQGLLSGKFRRLEDVPLTRRETRFYAGKWNQGRHTDTGFEKEIFAFLRDLQDIADQSGIAMTALALAFLTRRPEVGSILIGCRNQKQLGDNLDAFNTFVPDDIMVRVATISDALKPKMGSNPDLWENAGNGRIF